MQMKQILGFFSRLIVDTLTFRWFPDAYLKKYSQTALLD